MARSNSGDEGKVTRTPARRRADKVGQKAPAVAPQKVAPGVPATAADSGSKTTSGMSLRKQADVTAAPSLSDVQRRAYELYLQRGRGHGRDVEDWLEAERQLRKR
jgi:hypothetical protein